MSRRPQLEIVGKGARSKAPAVAPGLRRPEPPAELLQDGEDLDLRFVPAPELRAWAWAAILANDGPLHNPDHGHLIDADFAFLWASGGYSTKGKRVAATVEDLRIGVQGAPWRRARHAQQLREWFGREPAFLVTVDAFHAAECGDAAFAALIEHELYHVAQAVDENGDPVFDKEGAPKLRMVAHDLEEFVGIVERYGVGSPDGALARMVAAVAKGPTVSGLNIAHACGTCIRKTA